MVVGSAWGDNCYDAMDPPLGEGVLGKPIDEIDVYIVQGDREWLVATGAADDEYAFETVVVVPIDLDPGDAVVEARWGAGRVAYSADPRLDVTGAAPLPLSDDEVTTFVPAATSALATTTLPTVASVPSVPASSLGEPDTGSVDSAGVLRDEPDRREDSSTNATPIVVGLVIAAAAGAIAVGARRKG